MQAIEIDLFIITLTINIPYSFEKESWDDIHEREARIRKELSRLIKRKK